MRCGLVDKPQALARIVYRVFLPSLLTNAATTVASGAAAPLLPILLAAWVQICLGLLVASALLLLLRIPRDCPTARRSKSFNSGVLPLPSSSASSRRPPTRR